MAERKLIVKYRNTRRETCPNAISSTTSPMQTTRELNPELCCEMPVTNHNIFGPNDDVTQKFSIALG
jgi:hypothetical protein